MFYSVEKNSVTSTWYASASAWKMVPCLTHVFLSGTKSFNMCTYFWVAQKSFNMCTSPDLGIIRKNTRTCKNVYFTVPANDRAKISENKNRVKYLNLARKLKNLWNMKMAVMTVIIGELGTIPKTMKSGMEDLKIETRRETIQRTTLISAKIVIRVLEIWRD